MGTAKAVISKEQVLAGILKSIGANQPIGLHWQYYELTEVLGACDPLDKVAKLSRMEFLGEAEEEMHNWSREGFPEERMVFRFNLSEPGSEDLQIELAIRKGHIG